MQIIRINSQVPWLVGETSSGLWVGVCDALGITVQAKSEVELEEVIHESVQLLFTDLFDDGEFDAFLLDRGWTAHPEGIDRDGDVHFEVPITLLARNQNDRSQSVH